MTVTFVFVIVLVVVRPKRSFMGMRPLDIARRSVAHGPNNRSCCERHSISLYRGIPGPGVLGNGAISVGAWRKFEYFLGALDRKDDDRALDQERRNPERRAKRRFVDPAEWDAEDFRAGTPGNQA